MSMVQEAVTKTKELKNRVLTTVDAFRPKILIKKPLSEVRVLKRKRLQGQGVGTIMERVHNRIQEIRSGIGFGETATTETSFSPEPTSDMNAYLVTKKKGIHY